MTYFGRNGLPDDPREPIDHWVTPDLGATASWRDPTDSMTLGEASAVFHGADPRCDPSSQLAASTAVGHVQDMTMCSVCGCPVIHPPTHIRFHMAQAAVADALAALPAATEA